MSKYHGRVRSAYMFDTDAVSNETALDTGEDAVMQQCFRSDSYCLECSIVALDDSSHCFLTWFSGWFFKTVQSIMDTPTKLLFVYLKFSELLL